MTSLIVRCLIRHLTSTKACSIIVAT